jgi:MYXO-CTERM domain-containing protein
MSIAGTAGGATNFGVNLAGICSLVGDFDIQVDFQLGSWPSKSGVRTGLVVYDSSNRYAAAERVSLSATDVTVQAPGSEVYTADLTHTMPFPGVATTDAQGTLRLTRSGSSITGYFAPSSGGWTSISSASVTNMPVIPYLQAWSGDGEFNTQSGGASVYFRNFAVNSGQVDCPDAGVLGLDASRDVAEAGNTADAGRVAEAGNTADVGGAVIDANNSVETGKVGDTGSTADLGIPADANGVVYDASPAGAKDAATGVDVATTGDGSHGGCSCIVAGQTPSGRRMPFLFLLGIGIAALTRRRHR